MSENLKSKKTCSSLKKIIKTSSFMPFAIVLTLPLNANAGFLDSISSIQNTVSSIGNTARSIQYSKDGVKNLTDDLGFTNNTTTTNNNLAEGSVLTGKLNSTKLYTAPNKSSATVTSLSNQDIMIYMGVEQDGFLQVQSDKGEGWVAKPLVSVQY